MPVSSVPQISRFVLILQVGTELDGNPILKNRIYQNVKAEATDQDVFDVGQALASLQNYPLYMTERIDREELIQLATAI